MISKNEALKRMEETQHGGRRVPFSIAFITADRSGWERKKRMMAELLLLKPGTDEFKELEKRIEAVDVGGRIVQHDQCVLSGMRGIHAARKDGVSEGVASTGSATGAEVKRGIASQSLAMTRKNPRHWRNRTRNIEFKPSGQIRKCHISLIVNFNGQEVFY